MGRIPGRTKSVVILLPPQNPHSARVSYLDWIEGLALLPGQLLNSLVREVFQERRVPVAGGHLLLTPKKGP